MKRLMLAAGVMAVATAGVLYARSLHPDSVLRDLERAGPVRVFTPRLSIETEYHPCTPAKLPADSIIVPVETCGDNGDAPARMSRLARAGESLDPDTLHGSALATVIWGNPDESSLDAAIDRLLRALPLTLERTSLLADLSGVYLARAQWTGNPRDLLQGLDYALQSLEQEPRNAIALFNVALALEAFAIDGEAARAWEAYLAVDGSSPWSEEARANLRALRKPRPALVRPTVGSSVAGVDSFVAKHPQEAREMGWELVLGDWGSAVLEGRVTHAESLLGLADQLGKAVERRGGDASLADAVDAIRRAERDRAATRTLARAHRAYAVGMALYRETENAKAGDSFEAVIGLRPRSPALLAWARLKHAAMRMGDEPEATRLTLASLRASTESVRYPALLARVHWILGTRQLRASEHIEARASYEAATRIYERLGETEKLGATIYGEGEAAYESGDTIKAYRRLHAASYTLRLHRQSIRLHNVLLELASIATTDGMPLAAVRIQDEDVAVAEAVHGPIAAPEALMARARVRVVTRDTAGTRRDLRAAAALVGSVKDAERRETLTKILRLSQWLAGSPGTKPGSVAGLDSVVSHFAENNEVWLRPALLARADVHLASGNLKAAVADLDSVTTLIRGMTQDEEDFHLRAAMIEQAKERFDQLVMLHVAEGRTSDALRALERGRISFGPLGSGQAAAGGRLSAPAGQVAVAYALIGDTLLAWTVRDTSVVMYRDTVHRDSLLLAINRAGAALEASRPDDVVMPQLERLYDWLIRPVRGRLGPTGTPLVILADGEIARVPFPSLRDSRRRRYLVQDHATRVESSLADAARPALPSSAHSVLLVGNPAFNPREHPALDSLKGAVAEVEALRGVYPGARTLIGADATVEALLGHARSANVIHYAGHAVFDDTRPERSFLLLASDSAGGRLSADAVGALELGGVRLLVLSACRTLRSSQGRSGGFAGLSGALLSAGVGGVVGSLWYVDDDLVQPLMVEFHQQYVAGRDPAEALRKAQLKMLESGDEALQSPAAWAGFRYTGR
ncbi:MAG TPA: CHAT domain-containing protein [Longimicrobium sp.]|nr:CHAT domain-containing protein [Longimicrobium sp.]